MKKGQVESSYIFDLVDAIQAPVITFDVAWADCIPKRLIDVIRTERLISCMMRETMASYAEACAYMMTRTFNAPLDHDWTEIYTYVSCKVCEDHWKENHWAKVCPNKSLTESQHRDLKMLRTWIYEKRRNAVKKRIKLSEQKGSVAAKTLVGEQYKF